MAETKKEKLTCGECGTDVRDGTTFCYSCGSKLLTQDNEVATTVAQGAIVEPVISEDDDAGGLARAAELRRKSRAGLRKPRGYKWEATNDSRYFLLSAFLIIIIALGFVFVTVFWK